MPPSSLLDYAAGILSSDSAPDIMTRQAVVKELEKQKTKIVIAQEQDITIKHVKSPLRENQNLQVVILEKMATTERSSCVIIVMIKKESS